MLDGLNRFYISSQRQLTSFAPPRFVRPVSDIKRAATFEIREKHHRAGEGASVTTPSSEARDGVRRSVRYACLLAGTGAVEIPVATTIANETYFSLKVVYNHTICSRLIHLYRFPSMAL